MQFNIVFFFSFLALIVIVTIFGINITYIKHFKTVSINDLFFFNVAASHQSKRFLESIMLSISAFRGNKETMDLCRSYSKDTKVMERLNLYNSLIFVAFGWGFSFLYYMEYLPGTRLDYFTQNALGIYHDAPVFLKWSLIFYVFCLMQMLNDNIYYTIHFIDNLFTTKMINSKCIRFTLSIFFAIFNNTIIWLVGFKAIFLGIVLLYPNVCIGIPLLINLSVFPNQSLGRVLNWSSLIAIFFFFSLYSTFTIIHWTS